MIYEMILDPLRLDVVVAPNLYGYFYITFY